MINLEMKVKAQCDECEKKADVCSNLVFVFHDECFDKNCLRNMQEIMKRILDDKEWETYDGVGFKSEEDKAIFMQGIKYGMQHAFFWYAHNRGGDAGVALFEDIDGWRL